MTRKDYKLIAEVVKDNYLSSDYVGRIAIEKLAIDLANKLHDDNPRFLYKRFYDACCVEVA